MKTAEKILEQIKVGMWEVKHEEVCSCHFNWFLNPYDELVHIVEPGDCWERNTLLVAKKQVIIRTAEDTRFCVNGITPGEIARDVWSALYISDKDNGWEWPGNETHNTRRRESLIEWLLKSGYELDQDYPRDFANEYSMILREKNRPVTNTREDCEQWADGFLYRGNAANQAYVGFDFIPLKKG